MTSEQKLESVGVSDVLMQGYRKRLRGSVGNEVLYQ